jgi:hypothetical protein
VSPHDPTVNDFKGLTEIRRCAPGVRNLLNTYSGGSCKEGECCSAYKIDGNGIVELLLMQRLWHIQRVTWINIHKQTTT